MACTPWPNSTEWKEDHLGGFNMFKADDEPRTSLRIMVEQSMYNIYSATKNNKIRW